MNVALFILLPTVLLVCVELLKRVYGISSDVLRKVAHVGAGAINIAAPLYISVDTLILLNILFLTLLLLGRNIGYCTAIQSVKRPTFGDVYFPLGIITAAIVLLPEQQTAFQYGVAIMGFSDAFAGLVGERWGRRPITILRNQKTLIGAAAFFVTSVGITLAFIPQLLVTVVLIASILTAIEFVLVYGLDNLVLPVAAGLLYVALF